MTSPIVLPELQLRNAVYSYKIDELNQIKVQMNNHSINLPWSDKNPVLAEKKKIPRNTLCLVIS